MRVARLGLLVAPIAIAAAAAAGCVDVPANVRAQFAGPTAEDRSNYRRGRHGSAAPVEAPAEPKEAAEAGAPSAPSPEVGEQGDASAPEVAGKGADAGGATP